MWDNFWDNCRYRIHNNKLYFWYPKYYDNGFNSQKFDMDILKNNNIQFRLIGRNWYSASFDAEMEYCLGTCKVRILDKRNIGVRESEHVIQELKGILKLTIIEDTKEDKTEDRMMRDTYGT